MLSGEIGTRFQMLVQGLRLALEKPIQLHYCRDIRVSAVDKTMFWLYIFNHGGNDDLVWHHDWFKSDLPMRVDDACFNVPFGAARIFSACFRVRRVFKSFSRCLDADCALNLTASNTPRERFSGWIADLRRSF
jgi:hypothetical protein